jgi:hypothetical protein
MSWLSRKNGDPRRQPVAYRSTVRIIPLDEFAGAYRRARRRQSGAIDEALRTLEATNDTLTD